ncbi:FAD-dependent oxidoreductase [Vibrio sinaloensis]|nr:FAD-dependent oxidoreductase [Vibrio sinaloensis]
MAKKIAVIGGGIIGLSIALKLQLSGEHVTVIDKKGAGEGCSKGNAGHFATEQVFPLATPGLLPQLPKMMLSPSSPVSIRFQDIHKTFLDVTLLSQSASNGDAACDACADRFKPTSDVELVSAS